MGDISEHFSREEFACKCGCGFDTVDVELVDVLERLRFWANSPIAVTSGCRCKNHNLKVGGSKDSLHKFARAADIKVKNIDPRDVYEFLDAMYPDSLGVGLYAGWVHVDTRTGHGRWFG